MLLYSTELRSTGRDRAGVNKVKGVEVGGRGGGGGGRGR